MAGPLSTRPRAMRAGPIGGGRGPGGGAGKAEFSGGDGGRGPGGGAGRTGLSGGGHGRARYTNACLTMHQPWASLLVHGIKRVEGRSWPAPFTGRLWIHAAAKVPDPETIRAMEHFYREIYAVNGVKDIKFPEHYPVSRLLGCVEVVGCVKSEELICWEEVPESVRLEGLTDFCWLCENPKKLLVPFEMRGYQGVYNLERRIYDAAVRGLCPIQGPLPVKFPLPDPQNPFSLKPGSIALYFNTSKTPPMAKTSTVTAAIAGAQSAATQFSKKNQIAMVDSDNIRSTEWSEIELAGTSGIDSREERMHLGQGGSRSSGSQPRGSGKIFSAAMRGIRLNQVSRAEESRTEFRGYLGQ